MMCRLRNYEVGKNEVKGDINIENPTLDLIRPIQSTGKMFDFYLLNRYNLLLIA